MDLREYTGIGAFGPAYRTMLENDTHAPGSVDRVLQEQAVRLCPETTDHLYAEFTPTTVDYVLGTRPVLEQVLAELRPQGARKEDLFKAILDFTQGLGTGTEPGHSEMIFGGTEEEIIDRGSDWCTDVARVACVLCQIAGFSSRVVSLYDTEQAYSGHVIIEAYRRGSWGALDPLAGVIYLEPDGRPASLAHLMTTPSLIEGHRRAAGTIANPTGQFRGVGIANYPVMDRDRYDFTTSGLNDYYLSILEMSIRGWPGGLRWLHGEGEIEA
jgi:hypothetical protein